ncbi:ABC transporter substrate-binding protein [Methylobacterium nonmethylotrophicum]|nr:ABC transporter substrate-binding protein [Methylobacterium nonmethylotrophicum]
MRLAQFWVAAFVIAASAATAQPVTKVRFVQAHPNVAIGEEVFLYAVPKALGYFRAEGLDVEMTSASNGVAAGQFLQSGRAEFATIVAEGMLSMREQGATPLAFSSLKQHNGYSVGLLPGSPITSLADLSGKAVGFVSAGSGTAKILAESLRRIGIAPTFRSISVGGGPQIATALRSGAVDAVMLWDAVFGMLANQGLRLDHIELPIQDELAGMAMVTTEAYAASHPGVVAGFCRAFNKGLYFTRLNPEAAVRIFYKEFPTVRPADKDEATAVAEGVQVLKTWLSYAEKGVDLEARTGRLDPARWDFSAATFARLGDLKGTTSGSAAITNTFFEPCNDFDRAPIAAQASAASR